MYRFLFILFFPLIQIFLSVNLFAQAPDTLWTKTFGGNNDDGGASVQQTFDGGYIITGGTESFGTNSSDVWLIKTDANGDTLWTRTFGGSGDDGGNSVQQTSDSGYVITGFTSHSIPRYGDIWLIKTNVNGDTLWTRTFGGSHGASVQQTSDSGYIIVGQTVYHEVWLIKTDVNGDTLWIKDLGGNEDAYCASVRQTTDGGYIVTGFKTQSGGGSGDVWLIKTNSSGDIIWTKTFGGAYHDGGSSVQQTYDGGYIVAGTAASFSGIGCDVWLIKTDVNGDTLWTRTFDESDADYGNSVQQTSDSGYIVAGGTESFVTGNEDLLLIRTDANGNTLWTKTLGGIENDVGNSIQQTLDGGYIILGYSLSFGAGMADVWLIKIQPDTATTVGHIIRVPEDQPTIQAGINAAQDGDTVLVADSTYYENINFKGKAITVASYHLIDGDTSHISNTIIDGSQPAHPDSGSVVIFVSGEDTTSILHGFTITNGTGTINALFNYRGGGGIFCFNSGCRIQFNKIISNSITYDNEALGGGISIDALTPNIVSAIITENQIMNNMVSGVNSATGGGMQLINCSGKILNNIVSNNTCDCSARQANSAGIGFWSDTPIKPFEVIKGNHISYNTATGVDAGSIYGALSGGLGIIRCNALVQNNEITYNVVNGTQHAEGAGFFCEEADTITLIDANYIAYNTVGQGTCFGGGLNIYNANPKITNNIIINNLATYGGGIIFRYSCTAEVVNNKIVNNTALSLGGGIHFSSSSSNTKVRNTILWDNSAPAGNEISGNAIVEYSDVKLPSGVWPGPGNINADPSFSDTIQFCLLDFSPCIGAGTTPCPPFDIYGNPRPDPPGSMPDIGACESPLADPISGIENDLLNLPLTYSLSQNYPNPFNPTTTIKYSILKAGLVTINIYNVLGEEVTNLIKKERLPGNYEIEFNTTNLPSGVYFYRLQIGDFVETKKMVLLR